MNDNNMNSIGNSVKKTLKTFVKALLGSLAAAYLLVVIPLSAEAAGIGALDHFGGRIASVYYCNCSGNILLVVLDDSTRAPLNVIYQPGVSTLHLNYQISTPGVEVLGGLFPYGVCVIGDCETPGVISAIGTIDTLRGVGTSANPVTL